MTSVSLCKSRRPSTPWRVIASSADGSRLAAVPQLGAMYISHDAGQSWAVIPAAGERWWTGLSSSADFTLAASSARSYPGELMEPGGVYLSVDSGMSWHQVAPDGLDFASVAISLDGQRLAAATYGEGLLLSDDNGANWMLSFSYLGSFTPVMAMSGDGSVLVTSKPDNWGHDLLYLSTDGGSTWTAQRDAGFALWAGVSLSTDGSIIAAHQMKSGQGSLLWLRVNGTWRAVTDWGFQESLTALTLPGNGTRQLATSRMHGGLISSSNSGATWEWLPGVPGHQFTCLASSRDTLNLAVCTLEGSIFTSRDGGTSWQESVG